MMTPPLSAPGVTFHHSESPVVSIRHREDTTTEARFHVKDG